MSAEVPTSKAERRRTLARLVHDVGKRVSRAARNLPVTDPVPDAVLGMMVADLYGDRRASEVLAEGRFQLDEAALVRCASLLAEADACEAAVRRGEPAAVRRVAGLALEVDAALRRLAREALEEDAT